MHGYAQALVSEEIAAAYLEVPCIKVFLAKHLQGIHYFRTNIQSWRFWICEYRFTINVSLFPFVFNSTAFSVLLEDYLILCLQVFPSSSPYLLDISEAVVEVAESGALKDLDNSLTSSYKCLASESDDHTNRLRLSSFRGLFGIPVGTSTILAPARKYE